MAEFSPHALFKMAVRGISRDDVELVLADPDGGFTSRSTGRPCLVREVDNRMIHVVLEPPDNDYVVAVFVPDEG